MRELHAPRRMLTLSNRPGYGRGCTAAAVVRPRGGGLLWRIRVRPSSVGTPSCGDCGCSAPLSTSELARVCHSFTQSLVHGFPDFVAPVNRAWDTDAWGRSDPGHRWPGPSRPRRQPPGDGTGPLGPGPGKPREETRCREPGRTAGVVHDRVGAVGTAPVCLCATISPALAPAATPTARRRESRESPRVPAPGTRLGTRQGPSVSRPTALGQRLRPQVRSNSPSCAPSTKARHSSGVKTSTGPSGKRPSRMAM